MKTENVSLQSLRIGLKAGKGEALCRRALWEQAMVHGSQAGACVVGMRHDVEPRVKKGKSV